MKKANIHILLTLSIAFTTFESIAQKSDSTLNREVYLTGNFLELNDFGMEYKSEYKTNTYLRLGISNLYLDVDKTIYEHPSPINSPYSITSEFRGRFELGIEKRKPINEKFEAFISGNFILGGGFTRLKHDYPDQPSDLQYLDTYGISSGFAFNSGFIARITDNLLIAAEIVPELIFSYSTNQKLELVNSVIEKVKTENVKGTFKLDNEYCRLSIIYRWNKNN